MRSGLRAVRWTSSRHWMLGLVAGVALAIVIAIAAVSYDLTVLIAVPPALLFAWLLVRHPSAVYIGFLCCVSMLPIGGRFLGIFIPPWPQFLIPALVIASLAQGLKQREGSGLRLAWGDLFVTGFIALGYTAILVLPGPDSIKWFSNQGAFPAMLYFVARWLPIDRRTFLIQLRWQFGAALVMLAIMAGTPITGINPFYGSSWLGLGREARGPGFTISDSVAYATLWLPFMLYAQWHGLGLPIRLRWVLAVAPFIAMCGALCTMERTGWLGVAAAIAVCLIHPGTRRPSVLLLVAVVTVGPLALLTPLGHVATKRLHSLGEEGAGFERTIYRDKALGYMRSPEWNPVLGTGFGRLVHFSQGTTAAVDEWVYDYNWQGFRLRDDFSGRPTHCAPVTVLGEYGYGGAFCLLGLFACIGLGFTRARRMAQQQGRVFDSALVVASLAAAATVLANGWYHNTEAVEQVLYVVWSFAGTAVGHPEAFIMDPDENPSGLRKTPGAVAQAVTGLLSLPQQETR